MKRYSIVALLVAAFSMVGVGAYAQYDDIYFDPAVDAPAKRIDNRSSKQYQNYDDQTEASAYDTEDFDDEHYDYYYTSRIRRFHRPTYGFGYFDPVYTDMYYYDPFLTPGATMLIYDSPYSYGAWNRWNRWNRFGVRSGLRFGLGWGYDPFFDPFWGSRSTIIVNNFGRPWGWNSWGASPWGWNSWGANSWGGGGFYGGSGLYCPPSWGNGYSYNTPNAVANNVFYGPRSGSGSTGVIDSRNTAPRNSRERLGTEVESRTPAGTTSPRDRYERPADGSTPATGVRPDPRTRERSNIPGSPERNVPQREVTPERTTPNDYNRDPETAPRTRTYTPDRSRIERSDAQPPRSRTYNTPRATPSPSYDTPRSNSGGSYNRTPSQPTPRSYNPPSRSVERSSPAPSRSVERSSPSPSRSGGSSAPAPSRRGGN